MNSQEWKSNISGMEKQHFRKDGIRSEKEKLAGKGLHVSIRIQ